MTITKFNWNNGTENNPVPLTLNQITKLLNAYSNNIETNISGWITMFGDIPLSKGTIYQLSQYYPNLHYTGATENDEFNVWTTGSTSITEGQSLNLAASGLNASILNFAIEYNSISVTSGTITPEIIRSRISINVNDNNIILNVAEPQENDSWIALFKIKAYPKYESANTDNYQYVKNRELTEEATFAVTAVGVTSVTLTIASNLLIVDKPIKLSLVPNTGITKANIITNTFSTSSNIATISGDYITATATSDFINIAGTCTIGAVSFSDTLTTESTLVTTIRINQGVDSGSALIVGEGAASNCGIYYKDFPEQNVVAWIRKNSHCYAGVYNSQQNALEIRMLADTTRKEYAYTDGTTTGVSSQIDAYKDLDGNDYSESDGNTSYPLKKDIFMKLPKFYYKTEDEYDGEGNPTDIVTISFARKKADNSYHEWNSNTLIGVYEAFAETHGSLGEKLYSWSNVVPSVSKTYNTFSADVNRRNVGTMRFIQVDYKTHCVMALLYYGYYGSLGINCQGVVGSGTTSYPKTTGTGNIGVTGDGLATNDLGMQDTNALPGNTINGNLGSINFWGLENWWGDINEFVWGVSTTSNNGQMNITDPDDNSVRSTRAILSSYGTEYCVSKFIFGANADLLPKVAKYDNSYASGYCDGFFVIGAAGFVPSRGGDATAANGGVGRLYVNFNPAANAYASVGSRLLYKGAIIDTTPTRSNT